MNKILKMTIRILGILSSILVIVGTLIPYVRFSALGVERVVRLYVETNGYLILLIGIFGFFCSILNFHIGMFAAGIGTFVGIQMADATIKEEAGILIGLLQRQTGFYCLPTGGVGLLLLGTAGFAIRQFIVIRNRSRM